MTGQRIEVIPKDPNPLFTKWLREWQSEAVKKGLKSQYALREALESLKKYPLPLESGRDCAILKGFGPKLCMLLNQKLEEYKEGHLEEYNKSVNFGEQIKEVARKVKEKQRKDARTAKPKTVGKKNIAEDCSADEQVLMSPGSFDVVLLVDTQETLG